MKCITITALLLATACGPTPYFNAVNQCRDAHRMNELGANACVACVRDQVHAGEPIHAPTCYDAGGPVPSGL